MATAPGQRPVSGRCTTAPKHRHPRRRRRRAAGEHSNSITLSSMPPRRQRCSQGEQHKSAKAPSSMTPPPVCKQGQSKSALTASAVTRAGGKTIAPSYRQSHRRHQRRACGGRDNSARHHRPCHRRCHASRGRLTGRGGQNNSTEAPSSTPPLMAERAQDPIVKPTPTTYHSPPPPLHLKPSYTRR
jgi:hypothetical protein